LCAEIPCDSGDDLWSSSDEALGALVESGLAAAGLPLRHAVLQVLVRRLPAAYPIYVTGYEKDFDRVDQWVDSLERVLSFGRQGLYAHDNTHHAIYMARAAADCLDHRGFDRAKWERYRRIFDTHVVED
jgi:protoporphyrinogen oxidase